MQGANSHRVPSRSCRPDPRSASARRSRAGPTVRPGRPASSAFVGAVVTPTSHHRAHPVSASPVTTAPAVIGTHDHDGVQQLGGREERVQMAARPVQPKTVALQGETNGQTARSPTFMPEDPQNPSTVVRSTRRTFRHTLDARTPSGRRSPGNATTARFRISNTSLSALGQVSDWMWSGAAAGSARGSALDEGWVFRHECG